MPEVSIRVDNSILFSVTVRENFKEMGRNIEYILKFQHFSFLPCT